MILCKTSQSDCSMGMARRLMIISNLETTEAPQKTDIRMYANGTADACWEQQCSLVQLYV